MGEGTTARATSRGRAGGLTAEQARNRLSRFGPNALPEAEGRRLWRRVLAQFESPLIYILLFALLFDVGLWAYEGLAGWPAESIAIAAVLLMNAALGVAQEYRSDRALAELKTLAAPACWVIRDGRAVRMPSHAIVPGDLVRCAHGERVAADGVLLEAAGLLVDESILTGESLPVEKAQGAEVSSGTLAVRGHGLFEVTRTGPSSSMGRLAGMLAVVERTATPLERQLAVLGRQIAWVVGGIALALAVAGIAAEGFARLEQILLFAVALAVAAVPEGLPAVVTLALALGVQRMALRKAVVRRLSAVESLGSVTVIATDKTGTLTEGRMEVRELQSEATEKALQVMVLANDADHLSEAGDPLERALLSHAQQQGVDIAQWRGQWQRESVTPFDSRSKYMGVTVRRGAEGSLRCLKGAPEVLLARCADSEAVKGRWAKQAAEAAQQGFRVLGLAAGPGRANEALAFAGLVLLWDPPRAEVAEVVAGAGRAGVRILMVTGDHPGTARAVAAASGLAPGDLLTGAELERLSDAELRQALPRTTLFARVGPEHKLRIVELLQASGETVAVTGDGINDAPALKRADVGIAMGRRGSDVAREAADLILLDDNLATLVSAIEEGRGIFYNIQKFIRFLFSTNMALVLLVCLGAAWGYLQGIREPNGPLVLPLTALQLLWINLICDGLPALALALDRNRGLMERPPRRPGAGLLDAASVRFVLWTGGLKGAAGLALFIVMPWLGLAALAVQTCVFLFESLAQLAFAYPSRRLGISPLANPVLHTVIVGSVLLQLGTVTLAPLRGFLGLSVLELETFGTAVASAGVTWLVAEWLNRRLRAAAGAHG